ncbi:hypothetical protein ACTA71_011466 [Dictyostelium dimigraforme]
MDKCLKNPSTSIIGTFGWLVTIEDTVNGLKNGYIIVKGTIDSSVFNFTIEPSKVIRGNKFICTTTVPFGWLSIWKSTNYYINKFISNYGGKLMIYGRILTCGGSFSYASVLLKYSDDVSGGNYISITPTIIFDSFILIENIKANPSTEIPMPSTDNNSGNNENISKSIFKSLISLVSLVSLRELDFNGKEIKLYNFDKWIFTPLGSSKGFYETSINTHSNTFTNIRATLEWFNKSTTIEFANQLLEMNPSSIKYTIEINKYPFSKSLNTLQLVMSASLISSETNDICSSKEFGNTTNGDDSNYLKIQVDDHSVYGRFVKRAIIDSKVQSIENLLLDSSMKPISNSYSTQSYIGITIPQYSNQVIIDPDFSIIIDQRATSSNSENSICSNNSSSLSKGQIAGIIIGGVAFFS